MRKGKTIAGYWGKTPEQKTEERRAIMAREPYKVAPLTGKALERRKRLMGADQSQPNLTQVHID